MPATPAPSTKPTKFCQTCKNWLDIDLFKERVDKRSGDAVRAGSCMACAEKTAAKAREHRAEKKARKQAESGEAPKENSRPRRAPAEARPHEEKHFEDVGGLTAIDVKDLMDLLRARENVFRVKARVVEDPVGSKTLRERADALAESIGECMNYRFTYSSKYTPKELPYTRFVYHCAQLKTRQHVPRKSDTKKQRDKGMMHAFDCDGWLHMMIWDVAPSETSTPAAWISIKHDNDHIPYWRIEVPLPIQEYIQNNPEMRPKQLWDGILRDFGIQKFSRKSVYNLWAEREQKKWRRDADEKRSAELLIEEAVRTDWGTSVGEYSIQSVPLPQIDGIAALAFSMPAVLRKWGGRIREIALDSAWNTNGSAYEIYAVLGEIYGSGCPLAYLLIKVTTSQAAGTKEQYVEAVLRHLRDAWKINAHVTLSDKDWTEINACCAVFPEAKHQLCFWHAIRALKKRLPIKDRAPAFYDVVAAHAEFDFIKIDFVPVAQVDTVRDPVTTQPMTTQVPILNVIFDGQSLSQAPPPPPSQRPPPPELPPPSQRVTFTFNGIKQTTIAVYRRDRECDDDADEDDVENAVDDGDESGDEGFEGGQLLCVVERRSENLEADVVNVPDWMVDPDEKKSKVPGYLFCPAEHRKQIIRLFTKHFCLHPFFPEREKGLMSAEQIRRNSVWEMYHFCHARGLREVWGYMWTNWYQQKRWTLWARSTCARLPRLRTTMTVENFWKQLKHSHLHHLIHPRLDHLVYILIYCVNPAYLQATEIMLDTFRMGRSKTLTSMQKYFKSGWRKLATAAISAKTYKTDVLTWTCNCGRQKYHSHHLCKHLVQAVQAPPTTFWQEVVRRRTTPLYRHPALVPRGTAPGAYVDPSDGSISDGDDNLWSGDRRLLEHGRWRDAFAVRPALTRAAEIRPNGDSAGDEPPAIDLPPTTTTTDMTSATAIDHDGGISDDEMEREVEGSQEYADYLLHWLKKTTQYIEQQKTELPPEQSKIYFDNLKRKHFGEDVIRHGQDMEHRSKTGRTRDTTWVRANAPPRKRQRTANLLGYHPLSSSPAPSLRASSNAPPSSPPHPPSVVDDRLDSDELQMP